VFRKISKELPSALLFCAPFSGAEDAMMLCSRRTITDIT
jgi:hypothetical protein